MMGDEKKTLQEVMDGLPTRAHLTWAHSDSTRKDPDTGMAIPDRVSFVVSFTERGFGFGEVAIVEKDGRAFVDTEHMGLERVKKYINMLLDGAILDTDSDPDRHRLYNEVMGRRCCAGCEICGGEDA